ncbi:MAG: 50S ribosomal protein L24 [Candidatus Aenigmatarchaeota archaeon]
MVTKKPSKQRKAVHQAKMHVLRKRLFARLSDGLSKDMKRRSLCIRKGDEVKVMRGDNKMMTGKVTAVDLRAGKVYVDSVKRKKVSGEEVQIPLHASNLMIIKADMADKKRQRILTRVK